MTERELAAIGAFAIGLDRRGVRRVRTSAGTIQVLLASGRRAYLETDLPKHLVNKAVVFVDRLLERKYRVSEFDDPIPPRWLSVPYSTVFGNGNPNNPCM